MILEHFPNFLFSRTYLRREGNGLFLRSFEKKVYKKLPTYRMYAQDPIGIGGEDVLLIYVNQYVIYIYIYILVNIGLRFSNIGKRTEVFVEYQHNTR